MGWMPDFGGVPGVLSAQTFVPNRIDHGAALCPTCYCSNTDQGCEDYLNTILNISADPFFGDIYMEALDRSGHDQLLVMRADDYGVHNLYDLARGSKLCLADGGDQSCPTGPWAWVPGQGRISANSGMRVERMSTTFGGTPSFTDYPILK
jgi:hypothetical protein